MVKNIEIRKATLSDIDHIMSIIDNAAIWMHENGIKNQWKPGNVFEDKSHYLSCINNGHFYVALIDRKIAGTFLIKWSDKELWGENDTCAGYIHHFAIDRAFTGIGFGDYLLNYIEQTIKSNNKNYVRLDCIAANLKLNEYYLNRGYKFIQQYVYFDGKLGNLYEKFLSCE